MPTLAVAATVSAAAGAASSAIQGRANRKVARRNQEQQSAQFQQSLDLAEKKRKSRGRLNDQSATANQNLNTLRASRRNEIKNLQLRSKGIAGRSDPSASGRVLNEVKG